MNLLAHPAVTALLCLAATAATAGAKPLTDYSINEGQQLRPTLITGAGSMQELLADQSTDPYTTLEALVRDMLVLLPNPLNVAAFEQRLRRKGVQGMAIPALDLFEDDDVWVLQFMSNPQGNLDDGLFCRVAKDDTESVQLLRQVVVPVGLVEITAELAAFNINADAPSFSVVFEPCRINAVRTR